MATTGFWPVKGNLKAVIDYADNPDKTTERKYLDDDLAQALEYVANDDKTDRKVYVSGVNCTKDRAYEEMMAVQRRFGLRGTNVAYHGFQSFKSGEVSPEERSILKQILPYLRLNSALFGWECRQRGLDGGEAGSQARSDPYEVLGCSRNASDEEVKRAYREKAKQLHPDALRAQGLSDELISRANEQMARINAAWSEIKLARKL